MPWKSTGRRSFLRNLALLPFALWLGKGRDLFADEDFAKKMAKETDPLPSALKYVDDAKKAPKEFRKGADMFCKNCIQYTKKGKLKGKEVGTCNLFQGAYVTGDGWCMSWSKKA